MQAVYSSGVPRCQRWLANKMSSFRQQNMARMSFHFASSDYTACFQNLPTPDVPKIRDSTIQYLSTFDENEWYQEPVSRSRHDLSITQSPVGSHQLKQNKISSLLRGEAMRGGTMIETVNALGKTNGKQEYATLEQLDALKEHIVTYESPARDLRKPLRIIEEKIFSDHTGFLVGNQCLDFQKQDGITEIEEAVMANYVERNLNDLVLQEEASGRITVNRKPIYVSCVSNFTNFLDLSRKTIRSMELGIPCVILGRSNTVQHSYRWTKLLMELCIAEGVDPGMITYMSCPVEDIINTTRACQESTGNLYSTCSRNLAESIKSGYPNTIASTGGPNTLVALDWTDKIQEAIRMSATIESSGQCTALRHAVVPANITNEDISKMFEPMKGIESASTAVKSGNFDCVFPNHEGSQPGPSSGGYQRHESVDASYRMSEALPPNGIEEFWRKVVVDVSAIDAGSHIDDLAAWLNTNQPISLAVNGKTKKQSLDYGLALWERTGLVVNTIGTPENPALTCQARPQEGEIFGEFPPRRSLNKYTKYPVIVPSSTPGYDSSYSDSFLREQSMKELNDEVRAFLADIEDSLVRGYCVTLMEYLVDACKENPKLGFGTGRTALWGIQRPPLRSITHLRCYTSWDDLAPSLFLFYLTNAKEQVVVVSDHIDIVSNCDKYGIPVTSSVTEAVLSPGDDLKDISGPLEDFPMVGNFITTLLPVGHLKSSEPNDEEFIARAKNLDKWLKVV
eukprot:scaffold16150_cov112-Cylindrotheca_fusiformis.AAC.7